MGKGMNNGVVQIAVEVGTHEDVTAPMPYRDKQALLTRLRQVGAKAVSFISGQTKLVLTRSNLSAAEWQRSLVLTKAVETGIPVIDVSITETWGAQNSNETAFSEALLVAFTLTPPVGTIQTTANTIEATTVWSTPSTASWTPLTTNEITDRTDYVIPAHQLFKHKYRGNVGCVEMHTVFSRKELKTNGQEDPIVYRVFLQVDEKRALSECTSSAEKAEELFDFVWRMLVAGGFEPSSLVAGSGDRKVGNLNVSRGNAFFGAPQNSAPKDVLEVAVRCYTDLQRAVGEMLRGGFKTVHSLSLQDVLDAEGLLRVLTEKIALYVTSSPSNQETLTAELSNLMGDYKSAVKLQRLSFRDEEEGEEDFPDACCLDIAHESHKLGMIRTCLASAEFMGVSRTQPQKTPAIWQYLSLDCAMERVRGERLGCVMSQYFQKSVKKVNDTYSFEEIFTVDAVFTLRKPDEAFKFKTSLENRQHLLHCTPSSNVAPILAHGLQIPRAQKTRRDCGKLGKGLYFADDLSCLQYSGESDEFLYIFGCEVALGKVASTKTPAYDTTEAPPGFHSLHGQRSDAAAPSSFAHNEYCIYHTEQQQLRYLFRIKVNDVAAAQQYYETKFGKCFSMNTNGGWDAEFRRVMEMNVSSVTSQNIAHHAKEDPVELDAAVEPLEEVGLMFKRGAGGGEVPALLQKISVKGKLLDLVGEVVIFQHYRNNYNETVQGRYVFPLQEKAAVCGFEAFINGKHVIAVTKEKQQAQKEYKAAVKAGKGAYLLEDTSKETPEVFTISIGNLPPKTDVVIKLTYITELTVDTSSGCIKWILPREVHPKRTSGGVNSDDDEDSISDDSYAGDTIVNRHSDMGAFDLEIGVTMPWDITRIDVSHEHLMKRSAQRACIHVVGGIEGGDGVTTALEGLFESDFVLSIFLEDVCAPRMWVEETKAQQYVSGGGVDPGLLVDTDGNTANNGRAKKACMVCFTPETTETAKPESKETPETTTRRRKEVILAVDTSISMAKGEGITSALIAVQLCLHELEEQEQAGLLDYETTFNVVLFGLRTRRLFARARPVNPSTIQDALALLENECRVNSGGTDLFTLLRDLASLQKEDTCVIVFSDGGFDFGSQVSDCVALLKTGLSGCPGVAGAVLPDEEAFGERVFRVFAFAVGTQVCTHPLRVICAHGRGECVVLPTDRKSRWEDTIRRQIAKLGGNVLTQISVNWSGESSAVLQAEFASGLTQTPEYIPALFSQTQHLVFCLSERQPRRAEMLAISNTQNPRYTQDSTASEEPLSAATLFSEKEPLILKQEERFLVTPWPSHIVQGDVVHKLCVRNMIREYEQGTYASDYATHILRKREMRDAMVALGIEFNLVTRFTSMLAVEERTEQERLLAASGGRISDIATPSVDVLAAGVVVDALPEQVYRSSKAVAKEALEEKQLMQRLHTAAHDTEKAARKAERRRLRTAVKARRRERREQRHAADPLDTELRSSGGYTSFLASIFPPGFNPQPCGSAEEPKEEDASDDEEDGLEGLFDDDSDEIRQNYAGLYDGFFETAPYSRSAPTAAAAFVDLEEEEDDDMGFGLFDDAPPMVNKPQREPEPEPECEPEPESEPEPEPEEPQRRSERTKRDTQKDRASYSPTSFKNNKKESSPKLFGRFQPEAKPKPSPQRRSRMSRRDSYEEATAERAECEEFAQSADVDSLSGSLDDFFQVKGDMTVCSFAPQQQQQQQQLRQSCAVPMPLAAPMAAPMAPPPPPAMAKCKAKAISPVHHKAMILTVEEEEEKKEEKKSREVRGFCATIGKKKKKAGKAFHAEEKEMQSVSYNNNNNNGLADMSCIQDFGEENGKPHSRRSKKTGFQAHFGTRSNASQSLRGKSLSIDDNECEVLPPPTIPLPKGCMLGLICQTPTINMHEYAKARWGAVKEDTALTVLGLPRHLSETQLFSELSVFGEVTFLDSDVADNGTVRVAFSTPEESAYLLHAFEKGTMRSYLLEGEVVGSAAGAVPIAGLAKSWVAAAKDFLTTMAGCIAEAPFGEAPEELPHHPVLFADAAESVMPYQRLVTFVEEAGIDRKYVCHLAIACTQLISKEMVKFVSCNDHTYLKIAGADLNAYCVRLMETLDASEKSEPALMGIGEDWAAVAEGFLVQEGCVFSVAHNGVHAGNLARFISEDTVQRRKHIPGTGRRTSFVHSKSEGRVSGFALDDVYAGKALIDHKLSAPDRFAEESLSALLNTPQTTTRHPNLTHAVFLGDKMHDTFLPLIALGESCRITVVRANAFQRSIKFVLALGYTAADEHAKMKEYDLKIPDGAADELEVIIHFGDEVVVEFAGQFDLVDLKVNVGSVLMCSGKLGARGVNRDVDLRNDFLARVSYLRTALRVMQWNVPFLLGATPDTAYPRSVHETKETETFFATQRFIAAHDQVVAPTAQQMLHLRAVSDAFFSVCCGVVATEEG